MGPLPLAPLAFVRNTTLVLCLLLWLGAKTGLCAELLPPGHKPLPPGVHALTNARIVPAPGELIPQGILVIREGRIAAVGEEIDVPSDARVWDLEGATIYPGLIDPYVVAGSSSPPVTTTATTPIFTSHGIHFYGVPGEESDPGQAGPGYELGVIRPEHKEVSFYSPDENRMEKFHGIGFTAANLAPSDGVIRGSGVFVLLGERYPNRAILRPHTFQHVVFDTEAAKGRNYPQSLMGVIAAIRQAFFDARHYRQARDREDAVWNAENQPPYNTSLEALSETLEKRQSVLFEPGSVLMVERALRLAGELEVDPVIVASGYEWRRPDLVKEADAAFIVPVTFPAVPEMPEQEDWEQLTLDQLRHWDWAPENPSLLRKVGLTLALTTHGLPEVKQFRKNLKQAIDRGLSEEEALAALTIVPAELCGVSDHLGTLEIGKIANCLIVQGDSYFNPENKIREVWVRGIRYEVTPEEEWLKEEKKKENKEEGKEPSKVGAEKEEVGKEQGKETEKDKEKPGKDVRVAKAPLSYRGPILQPPTLLVRNATIWTCGSSGILTESDLLVTEGRIKEFGRNLKVPDSFRRPVHIIDAKGKHVTPGLVDAHSHSMILGGVNESTLPSTAMVRIQDVVNSETDHIYQQLAGGVTAAHLLHGSANPIGGQNAVIKLKDGASPMELIFDPAPPGIKFALGENVKQSNWGDDNTSRFPQTRMGVRTFIANRFTAAQQYLRAWERHRSEKGLPPRRNLELEALGEILQGKRWIHCHSYRQDEILAFLRLMEDFGVKVGTLQHVLEGYKVADEIAAHGAGASTFSDWWAYKFEVYDAIPYNGALMHDRGVLVSFNSDSSDLARRLYLEAAKAVKYGGMSETEALHLMTIHPANQLRMADRVGSIEKGKDADLVLWSHSPLDYRTVCHQTWIEGALYFDREEAGERTRMLKEERQALLEKAKGKSKGKEDPENEESEESGKGDESQDPDTVLFFQEALELRHDHTGTRCMECCRIAEP